MTPPEPTQDTTVTLGDVQFDPVAVNDFRLSIEGTSNTGKSNTLAVVLEDLADVRLPTLIVERLGALTPVRTCDEDLIVVGAREEEGIDIAVGLEELDRIGEWVLDDGRKILLDISTYAEYEHEQSRVHLAAATAIQALNDRAHEKYRTGDRTKSLLVVDEAHILAPKDSAPEPELDDYVKRCRGQLIKAATEGGNKGISIVTAYQRRAFLHNGVIQLCEDYIAHKPGDEDIDRTAKALRVDPDELAALGTGAILARGTTITDGTLVGPTTVRKRTSPDPREETFDLPEATGETEAFLASIAEDVEAERKEREQRQDEIERLEDENARLRDRVEELEQELADTDRLANALDNLSGDNGGAVADVGEGVSDLQGRVQELKDELADARAERETVEDELIEATERNDALREEIADLEATVQEMRANFDMAGEAVERIAEALDVDVTIDQPTPADTDHADRIAELEAENERLRRQADADISEDLETYEDFLSIDVVREEIDRAKQADRTSPRYVKGVLAAIIDEHGPVAYDTIAERLGIGSNTHVSKAATELETRKIVTKDTTGDGMRVDLNVDGIESIRKAAAERERTEQLMEEL